MELRKNEKLENSRVELEIAVDAAAFSDAVSKAFKKNAKNFNVPGFRKGKAPRHLIEQMYGKDVFHYDAVNEIFPEVYDEAVKAAGLEPVDRPEAELVSTSLEDGAVLKVVVTVKPEVELGDYKGLKATKTVHTVDASEADAEIAQMQQRNARTITREGKAENGDIAVIDFEGFVDGVAFEGGKGENFSLALGSGQFIPGFEEQVVGHEAGEEFDIEVNFPEEYQAKELAGKAATFKIKLHEVKTKELPELDDEFAKDVSEYDTLAELKDSILKRKQEQTDKEDELNVENALVDQVVDGMKAEIPDCMVSNRVDEMVRDFEYRLEQQGLKLEMYLQYTNSTMEKFREGFREQAEKQVKIRLALEKIVELEKIEASEEDFDAEIKRIAAAYQMEEEKIRSVVPAAEVKKDLAVNKAIDFIKSNAVVTEEAAKEEKAEEKND